MSVGRRLPSGLPAAATIVVVGGLLCAAAQAWAGQNPLKFWGKKPVAYNVYRDPINRFQIDYPQKELRLLPTGGSSLAVFTRDDGTSLFVDYVALMDALTAAELSAMPSMELDLIKKAEPRTKEFKSDTFDAKAGRGVMIRYTRLDHGPERAMHFTVAKGRDLFRIHGVTPEASAEKYEPILLHMIQSFQAPAEPPTAPAPPKD